ncbi:hypothetical protein GQR58_003770 [Nymphon striatum]|nr:hypothetical protein GQR58_003770 [Nymphon striatum]
MSQIMPKDISFVSKDSEKDISSSPEELFLPVRNQRNDQPDDCQKTGRIIPRIIPNGLENSVRRHKEEHIERETKVSKRSYTENREVSRYKNGNTSEKKPEKETKIVPNQRNDKPDYNQRTGRIIPRIRPYLKPSHILPIIKTNVKLHQTNVNIIQESRHNIFPREDASFKPVSKTVAGCSSKTKSISKNAQASPERYGLKKCLKDSSNLPMESPSKNAQASPQRCGLKKCSKDSSNLPIESPSKIAQACPERYGMKKYSKYSSNVPMESPSKNAQACPERYGLKKFSKDSSNSPTESPSKIAQASPKRCGLKKCLLLGDISETSIPTNGLENSVEKCKEKNIESGTNISKRSSTENCEVSHQKGGNTSEKKPENETKIVPNQRNDKPDYNQKSGRIIPIIRPDLKPTHILPITKTNVKLHQTNVNIIQESRHNIFPREDASFKPVSKTVAGCSSKTKSISKNAQASPERYGLKKCLKDSSNLPMESPSKNAQASPQRCGLKKCSKNSSNLSIESPSKIAQACPERYGMKKYSKYSSNVPMESPSKNAQACPERYGLKKFSKYSSNSPTESPSKIAQASPERCGLKKCLLLGDISETSIPTNGLENSVEKCKEKNIESGTKISKRSSTENCEVSHQKGGNTSEKKPENETEIVPNQRNDMPDACQKTGRINLRIKPDLKPTQVVHVTKKDLKLHATCLKLPARHGKRAYVPDKIEIVPAYAIKESAELSDRYILNDSQSSEISNEKSSESTLPDLNAYYSPSKSPKRRIAHCENFEKIHKDNPSTNFTSSINLKKEKLGKSLDEDFIKSSVNSKIKCNLGTIKHFRKKNICLERSVSLELKKINKKSNRDTSFTNDTKVVYVKLNGGTPSNCAQMIKDSRNSPTKYISKNALASPERCGLKKCSKYSSNSPTKSPNKIDQASPERCGLKTCPLFGDISDTSIPTNRLENSVGRKEEETIKSSNLNVKNDYRIYKQNYKYNLEYKTSKNSHSIIRNSLEHNLDKLDEKTHTLDNKRFTFNQIVSSSNFVKKSPSKNTSLKDKKTSPQKRKHDDIHRVFDGIESGIKVPKRLFAKNCEISQHKSANTSDKKPDVTEIVSSLKNDKPDDCQKTGRIIPRPDLKPTQIVLITEKDVKLHQTNAKSIQDSLHNIIPEADISFKPVDKTVAECTSKKESNHEHRKLYSKLKTNKKIKTDKKPKNNKLKSKHCLEEKNKSKTDLIIQSVYKPELLKNIWNKRECNVMESVTSSAKKSRKIESCVNPVQGMFRTEEKTLTCKPRFPHNKITIHNKNFDRKRVNNKLHVDESVGRNSNHVSEKNSESFLSELAEKMVNAIEYLTPKKAKRCRRYEKFGSNPHLQSEDVLSELNSSVSSCTPEELQTKCIPFNNEVESERYEMEMAEYPNNLSDIQGKRSNVPDKNEIVPADAIKESTELSDRYILSNSQSLEISNVKSSESTLPDLDACYSPSKSPKRRISHCGTFEKSNKDNLCTNVISSLNLKRKKVENSLHEDLIKTSVNSKIKRNSEKSKHFSKNCICLERSVSLEEKKINKKSNTNTSFTDGSVDSDNNLNLLKRKLWIKSIYILKKTHHHSSLKSKIGLNTYVSEKYFIPKNKKGLDSYTTSSSDSSGDDDLPAVNFNVDPDKTTNFKEDKTYFEISQDCHEVVERKCSAEMKDKSINVGTSERKIVMKNTNINNIDISRKDKCNEILKNGGSKLDETASMSSACNSSTTQPFLDCASKVAIIKIRNETDDKTDINVIEVYNQNLDKFEIECITLDEEDSTSAITTAHCTEAKSVILKLCLSIKMKNGNIDAFKENGAELTAYQVSGDSIEKVDVTCEKENANYECITNKCFKSQDKVLGEKKIARNEKLENINVQKMVSTEDAKTFKSEIANGLNSREVLNVKIGRSEKNSCTVVDERIRSSTIGQENKMYICDELQNSIKTVTEVDILIKLIERLLHRNEILDNFRSGNTKTIDKIVSNEEPHYTTKKAVCCMYDIFTKLIERLSHRNKMLDNLSPGNTKASNRMVFNQMPHNTADNSVNGNANFKKDASVQNVQSYVQAQHAYSSNVNCNSHQLPNDPRNKYYEKRRV